MAIHESGQMYLETIYILSQNSAFVRAIDVGEQLGFTKPRTAPSFELSMWERSWALPSPASAEPCPF